MFKRVVGMLFWIVPYATTCLTAAPAHAQIAGDRFAVTAHGGLRVAGNTLGLSCANGSNAPGTQGSIGTFLTVDPLQVDNAPPPGWPPGPPGTTSSWLLNSSDALLDLPAGASVLHAELVWGGSYNYGVENVSASLDNAVALSFEGGQAVEVEPDPETAVTLAETDCSGFMSVRYYTRSANVTTFVAAHHGGMYTVRGVPATQDHAVSSLNAAGWCLVVAYEDATEPLRLLTIRVGSEYIDECEVHDYTFTGFAMPSSGPAEARLVLAALEGDANTGGDQVLVSDSGGNFSVVAGPNNPPGNFFASQINDADGLLETSGTAGGLNHDALSQANVVAGRQGWDVTGVIVSEAMGLVDHGQTEISVRALSSGDAFILVALGIAIDTTPPAGVADLRFPRSGVRLEPAAPNPFTRGTIFRYALGSSGHVRLRVMDPNGRLVRTLIDGHRPAGEAVARWDGCDGSGRAVEPGIYLVELEREGVSSTRKVAAVR